MTPGSAFGLTTDSPMGPGLIFLPLFFMLPMAFMIMKNANKNEMQHSRVSHLGLHHFPAYIAQME